MSSVTGPTARRAPALPAKLCPPALRGTLPRARLHDWLDAQSASLIWIAAAPGSGKTTLAASWSGARGVHRLWYRLDADDNDLSRFFTTLGMAVDALGRRARRPEFSAEHLAKPDAFARRWFRAVFAALPQPVVLVLDNLEQASLPALPQVLAAAVAEATANVRLIVTARHGPPAALAGAVVSGAVVELPPTVLSFTAREADDYARLMGLDAATVGRAAAQVQGWAAGLRLLVPPAGAASAASAPRLLADYFAGLVDEQLHAVELQQLLVASLLPYVPAVLVDAVSGTAGAQALFERLCAFNLFTEPVASEPGSYRLHPLFVQFLRGRSARAWLPAERTGRLCAAAHAFAARGEMDTAIDLALDGGDGLTAAAWLQTVLEARLAAGQLDQIAAWCARLGDAMLDACPELRYGLARACFMREDPAALLHYARACDAYAVRGGRTGQRLCAAGMLETAYNQDSFLDHARWSQLLLEPPDDALEPADERHRLRLLNGQLLACFYLGNFAPAADLAVERVLALLVEPGAAAEKLCAAITLLGLLERHKRWDEAQLLAGRMEALLDAPGVGPRLAILVRQQIAGDLYRQTGRFDEARRLAQVARHEAREQGFAVLEYEAVAIQLLAALHVGEGAAAQLLSELAGLARPGNVYHQRFASAMQAWHEAQGGRLVVAQEHAAALRAAVERSDMPPRFRSTWLLQAMMVRFLAGDEDGACAELQAASEAAEPGSRETLRANWLALRGVSALRRGERESATALVAEAFGIAAPIRYHQLLPPMREALSQLVELALERGVAAGFAVELARRRRLAPPSPAARHWPWPVYIRTLGSFEIEVDGVPLRFAGKTPRKPLALLKALVAFGPQSVHESRLADALWPDDGADAARDALNVALHRLRKLIPAGAERVPLRDGQIALDTQQVWVDARAFEHLAAAAERGTADALPALQAALALYRGHFLLDDSAEPWAVLARERLRGRCRRVVAACARALTDAQRVEEALECWQRGLEIDELDETCTQGVMACCLHLSRAAQGLAAYQRCRRVLSLAMGIAPSAATEVLAARLRALG